MRLKNTGIHKLQLQPNLSWFTECYLQWRKSNHYDNIQVSVPILLFFFYPQNIYISGVICRSFEVGLTIFAKL